MHLRGAARRAQDQAIVRRSSDLGRAGGAIRLLCQRHAYSTNQDQQPDKRKYRI